MNILGYNISLSNSISINGEKKVINTLNPHSYVESKSDLEFREALLNSSILIPDGTGIVLAARLIHKKRIRKIAGADMHAMLLERASNDNLSVFYLGSSEATISKIESRIQKELPRVRCGSYSPPFKSSFTEEDSSNMINAVNQFKPDILFVGMTAPKQEKWVHAHKERLNVRVICSIGAVFDFYAGTQNRAPEWMLNVGLEWLHRLFLNPKRMWKRNFISTPVFLKDVLISRIKRNI
jgi:N-acetylglucosaminyldiphosphoundecaprenol N-acetyl-beta-D-mannosaminyltransferase